MADEWPNLASRKISLGDATVKQVAEFYAAMNLPVEILTGDQGLKAYQPETHPFQPRRRKNQ